MVKHHSEHSASVPYMFKNILQGKSIISIFIISVVLVIALIIFLSVRFAEFSESLINGKLVANINSLNLYLDESQSNSKAAAVSMMSVPEVINAIKEKDREKLLQIFVPMIDLYRISYYVICDNEGKVLARTHEPESYGDSILDQQNVKDALEGRVASYFEGGNISKVSARTGAPVYDADHTLIGAISAGVRFDTEDEVKRLKNLFNSEVTVFLDNTRIATTITKDGHSIVGTTLDPKIADIVIKNKEDYVGKAYILDEEYKTVYKPLLNPKNEAFAAIFLGMRMAEMTRQRNYSILTGIIIGFTELLFLTLLLFRAHHEKRQFEIMLDEMAKKSAEAKAASVAKSAFLTNMSHEIRTPLNAIIGMTFIGKTTNDMERKNYTLGKIESASSHLLGIINDILDMSKIEANKMELSILDFDFHKVIKNVIDIIQFRVNEKKQDFHVSIDENIPDILSGDDQRLSQVITNLLSNAVKFTPEKGTITLDTRLVDLENGICVIEFKVSDTGIGISKEQQANLFNSFEQAENSIARKFGGTGLGLAISKRIVEMMGGRIWIESELGKGSVFFFTIRIKRAETTHLREHADVDKTGQDGNDRNTFRGCRLLLAEDVELNREIVVTLLKSTELEIECAENGVEALRMFSERPDSYDMIFMDVQMPEMDGLETTRRIRSLDFPNAKSVPIVAMTANAFREDVEVCLNAGMDGHVGKPLDIEAILKKLRKHLANKRQDAS